MDDNPKTMKNTSYLLLLSAWLLFACSEQNVKDSSEESKEDIEAEASAEAIKDHITGYASLEELTEEVVYSIKTADYDDYITHVMTKEMEETVAREISDSLKHDHFISEFGFSIDHEKEEFDDMIKFITENNINLDNINFDEVEVIDYKPGEYAPLTLKEVMIVVPHDYEVLLIYTALQIEDRWYLTSELSL